MLGLWFDFICAGADGNMPKRQKNKKQYGNGANGENAKKPAAKPAPKPKPAVSEN